MAKLLIILQLLHNKSQKKAIDESNFDKAILEIEQKKFQYLQEKARCERRKSNRIFLYFHMFEEYLQPKFWSSGARGRI